MEIREGTLVVTLPYKGILPKPCWGLVEQEFEGSGFLQVRTGKKEEEVVIVPPGRLIFVLQTDGSVKTPEAALKEHRYDILIWVICKLREQKEEEELPEDVKPNTLVIVLAKGEKPPRSCWGLVVKKLQTSYDVRIGRIKKILVPPDQLIPVIETSGSIVGPMGALRQNIDNILMHIIFQLYIQRMEHGLHQLFSAMANMNL